MSGGKKQTTTSTQTANTTTQLPAWMTQAGQDLYTQAANAVPTNAGQAYTGQMTAGTSANQQAASATAAGNAGNWQGDLNTARAMTTAAASAPAATVSAQSVNPAQMRAAQQGWANAGATPQAQAAQQGWASAGAAPTVQGTQQTTMGYQAAGNGTAPSVTADQVQAGQFDATAAAKYMNPYAQQVQQQTLDSMRQQDQADHAALNDSVQGAKAFGGTRQAVLEAEQAKNQAKAREDYVNTSNAAAYTDAQQQFERDRAASMQAQTSNQAANLQAGTTNASFLDALLGRTDAASQFNAAAANTASGANADRAQAANLANQQQQGAFALADQGAANQAAGANADRTQAASEANAGRQQQTNLANQSAANTAMGANADRTQAASQFNADSRNTVGAANADRSLAADTTNANQWEAMLARLMGGGQQMGQIGEATSALGTQDVQNLTTTGAIDQATEQAGLDAAYQEYLRSRAEPMDYYSQLMSVLNGTPRDVTTSGTTSGTQTQKTSGSFLDSLMGIAGLGLSAYSGGLFGGKK